MLISKVLRNQWGKIINANWDIAIAEIGGDLSPVNIRWVKHDYRDRWFADPFLLEETSDTFVILAEEFMQDSGLGRICMLFVDKKDCRLIQNETLLELDTHLSFPNVFNHDGKTYVYPENCASGQLTIYQMIDNRLERKTVISLPLMDPVVYTVNDGVILLGTLPEDNNGNGNVLHVYKSNQPIGTYTEIQQISFKDNIARRAGNIFEWKGRFIAPAQVCNKHYGEGISLQELKFSEDGSLSMEEINRLEAKQITKMTGFHTYNVLGNKVAIDGYHYGSEFIHDLYFDLRGLKYM